MRSGRPILCAPPRLSGVSPNVALETVPMLVWLTQATHNNQEMSLPLQFVVSFNKHPIYFYHPQPSLISCQIRRLLHVTTWLILTQTNKQTKNNLKRDLIIKPNTAKTMWPGRVNCWLKQELKDWLTELKRCRSNLVLRIETEGRQTPYKKKYIEQ